jgi:hypothetical protein
MKTPHTIAALFALIVIVSACTPDGPTAPEVVLVGTSGRPAYDGGVMYGSGNAASTQTQTAADSSGATAERGGVMYGSGN